MNADASLRHSEEKLRKLYALSPLGIALTDMQGRFLDFNEAFVRIAGHEEGALRDLSYWDLTPREFEPAEQHNLWLLNEVGRYGPYEKVYRCADGRLRPVRLNGVRIELDGQPCIWSIVEDLTERQAAEEEHHRVLRQLMQAQKMEAVGQLAGGIAHDFNNMLAAILGLSTLALERHVDDPDSKIAAYLRNIACVSERGRVLVDRLMRFSRPTGPEPAQIRPVGPVVQDIVQLLHSTLPSQMHIELRVEPDLPRAHLVEIDLHQMLTNLVINSRDASGGTGRIDIEVVRATRVGCVCSSCGQRVLGPRVAVRVSDQAGGIPQAIVGRIFDPFFTTKDVGKGTGLGLAMVHGLVHQCSGHVVVSTQPGVGTTVELLLAACAPSPRRRRFSAAHHVQCRRCPS